MFLPSAEIEKVAIEYLISEIAPKLPIGPKYALYLGIGMISSGSLLERFMPTLKLLGVLDEYHRVDIEKARIAATDAMTKVGGRLPMYGYVADQSDIEAIYNIAKKYSTL
jgi:hypothetical protein